VILRILGEGQLEVSEEALVELNQLDDHLGPSELILPGADATLDEVRKLLHDDGLIPG
jgi:hypothetical protein